MERAIRCRLGQYVTMRETVMDEIWYRETSILPRQLHPIAFLPTPVNSHNRRRQLFATPSTPPHPGLDNASSLQLPHYYPPPPLIALLICIYPSSPPTRLYLLLSRQPSIHPPTHPLTPAHTNSPPVATIKINTTASSFLESRSTQAVSIIQPASGCHR